MSSHNEITSEILNASIDIHRRLGPGLLESVYKTALAHELRKRGLEVQAEVPIPLAWDGVQLEIAFRADLIVNAKVMVELKSVEEVRPVHKKQLRTYLCLTDLRVGLLLNFNEEVLREGITRVVNQYHDD